MNPEEKVAALLQEAGVDLVLSLPCDRVKALHSLLSGRFRHVPLTREEEGVGIAAGAALSGLRPAMLVQTSGVGNMLNALASLTLLYQLPLFIMISWRGVYREEIVAQRPMGRYVPRLLEALGIEFVEVREREEIQDIAPMAEAAFREERVTAALLSPKLWEGSTAAAAGAPGRRRVRRRSLSLEEATAGYTRYEMLSEIREMLRGKAVVCNLGVPCKELYSVLHQPSNFYMLGSMGMATPIGLGMALGTRREVVVIDGDGSLLMNAGCLATVAEVAPRNLTILAMDNGTYGSTGDQPTAALRSADLGMLAGAMGIGSVCRASEPEQVLRAMRTKPPRFVHVVLRPGNAPVGNIPLSPVEIRRSVEEFLRDED
ncbi:MAG: sulfopyruvate decarboxylase subunit alpha [Euryarchaeota archaeon]|nr:sulfopyruvate decarboxylase subunit alpha [Euryarchaeota archaeon]